MNKTFTVMLISLLLSACAQHSRTNKKNKFVNIAKDPIQTESLERLAWSSNDLTGHHQALVTCYKGEVQKGLEQLRLMVGKEKDANYWNMVGNCYYWSNEFTKAKFYFELGLSVDDKNTDLLHNLALVELMQGRVQLATRDLIKIIQKDSSALLPRWNLALIYYSNKSPELALEQLKVLRLTIPNDPLVNLLVIKSYIALEDFENATATYAGIPSEYKNYTEFQNIYAYALIKKQSLNEAHKILQSPSTKENVKKDHEFRSALSRLLNQLQQNATRKTASEQDGK